MYLAINFDRFKRKTSLIELAGACERADAVISVDSGPLHIAAAVNTNVLAVVGNGVTGKELVLSDYGCHEVIT